MKYASSEYWKMLNDGIEKEFITFGGYENFKRSAGRVYNDDYKQLISGQGHELYHLDCAKLWNFLYKLLPKDFLDKFEEPLEGNPVHYIMFDRPITIDLGCSILEYWNLSKKIDFSKINTIYEIGGGYGRTAYVITKLHPHIKYVMYDLKTTSDISKRYLTSVAPWGNFEFKSPEELDGDCDLFISIDCLAEMTIDTVNNYFEFIDKHSKYFYFVTWLKHQIKLSNKDRDTECLNWNITDYPTRKEWNALIIEEYIRKGWIECLYQISA